MKVISLRKKRGKEKNWLGIEKNRYQEKRWGWVIGDVPCCEAHNLTGFLERATP